MKRLEQDEIVVEIRAQTMNRINPNFIQRNHEAEEALSTVVNQNDMMPFSQLLTVLSHPFAVIAGNEAYPDRPRLTIEPHEPSAGPNGHDVRQSILAFLRNGNRFLKSSGLSGIEELWYCDRSLPIGSGQGSG